MFPLQVKMDPPHDGIIANGFHEFLFTFFVIILAEFFFKIKVVSTNKGEKRRCNILVN